MHIHRTTKLLSRLAGALLLAAFAVSCKPNVDTPKTETFSVTFSTNAKEYGTLTATLDDRPFTGGDVAEGKTVEFTAKQADDYMVGKWHVTGSSFIDGTGSDGSTTARVKITANTHVRVGFIPLPYISVPFGENGKNLDNYLKTANAASDGIYYIEVTGLTASDVKSEDPNAPSLLGQTLKNSEPKRVALKLGTITGLTDMCFCFHGCTNLVKMPVIPNGVTNMAGCFADCKNLTQAPVIPGSVKDMSGCFSGCTSLTQAPEIPSSVTNMSSCFYSCTSLRSVTLKCNYPSSNPDAFKYAFKNCSSLAANSIKVPADQLSAYQGGASNMGTTADRFVAE